MTTIANLTRAELRKLATGRAFLITLAVSVGLAVTSVIAIAVAAGKNGVPALSTTVGADSMLKLGIVCCVAMLVLGILASGGEYRHKTIIPAMLITPRRGALVATKVIAVAFAGAVLSSVTFGAGLAAAAAELSAHGVHHLPADTTSMFVGSVITGTLFGVIGVALGYITRSTVAATIGAVAWVMFAEQIILRTVAPHQVKWLISGTASDLTTPVVHGSAPLTTATAVAVLSAYTLVLLAAAALCRTFVGAAAYAGAVPEQTPARQSLPDRYEDLIDELLGIDGVTPPSRGAGFGRSAVRFHGKIFVMFVRGSLVLKLPAPRVEALVAAGDGVHFDANKGTPMKEWLSLDPDSDQAWLPLAHEALDFARATRAAR